MRFAKAPGSESPFRLIFAALLALVALIAIVGFNSANEQDHSVILSVASAATGPVSQSPLL